MTRVVGVEELTAAARIRACAFHDDLVVLHLTGGRPLPEDDGIAFFRTFCRFRVSRLDKLHPDASHWYLGCIGSDPAQRGPQMWLLWRDPR